MSDKPKVHVTLTALEAEGTEEPFVFGIGNSRATFPDIFELPYDEADLFLRDIMDGRIPVKQIFKKWLSEEDFEKVEKANLNYRQAVELMNRVTTHYQGALGNVGE